MPPVKYILPYKKSYLSFDICPSYFLDHLDFFSASACFLLREITFSFKVFSLSSKSAFFRRSVISALVAKFTGANLAVMLFHNNELNSCVAIHLLV